LHAGCGSIRPDLIINNSVIIEVKATRKLDPVFARQLLNYLEVLDLRPGLLMIFGMATMKDGICRFAN
jgi:GxxExxY protein